MDELSLEHLIPPEERYEACDKEDEGRASSLERISHFNVLTAASRFICKEPAIPITYFASLQEPLNNSSVPDFNIGLLGDEHLPSGVVFVFEDVNLLYMRVHDGNVIEVEDDTSRVYAANGELLRTVTGEPVE